MANSLHARHVQLVLLVGSALLAAVLLVPSFGQEPPPEDFIASESIDVTGDATTDTILAAPSGADPQASARSVECL